MRADAIITQVTINFSPVYSPGQGSYEGPG